jgi:hypothetical protein
MISFYHANDKCESCEKIIANCLDCNDGKQCLSCKKGFMPSIDLF